MDWGGIWEAVAYQKLFPPIYKGISFWIRLVYFQSVQYEIHENQLSRYFFFKFAPISVAWATPLSSGDDQKISWKTSAFNNERQTGVRCSCHSTTTSSKEIQDNIDFYQKHKQNNPFLSFTDRFLKFIKWISFVSLESFCCKVCHFIEIKRHDMGPTIDNNRKLFLSPQCFCYIWNDTKILVQYWDKYAPRAYSIKLNEIHQ